MTLAVWEKAIDGCDTIEQLESTGMAIKLDRHLTEVEKTELRVIYLEAHAALIIMDMHMDVSEKAERLQRIRANGKTDASRQGNVSAVHGGV